MAHIFMGFGRLSLIGFIVLNNISTAVAADVLFYGWGKGKNLQQTGVNTTINEAVDPWEVTSFVFLNPTGAVSVAYFGTAANPTLYLMNNDGDRFQVGASAASQGTIDSQVPNGTYRITMQTVHEGTKVADLALTGNSYPNTPMATNYLAMQSVSPGANFTVYWNAFSGGTTNDVIIASLVANQFAPYGSITNSPYPGMSGTLNGTNRAWTIPSTLLPPNSTQYVRVVFYKAVSTNKTAYAGVTGYAIYGTGTTIPLITTTPPPPAPVANPATGITASNFVANWSSASGATGYRLDVSTNVSFANYVGTYQNLDVANVTSRSVTGLVASTTFYYRVRAYNLGGTSGNSGAITAITAAPFVPSLGYHRSGTNLILTWATNDPTFKLHYATNLSAVTWISNPISPSIVNGKYVVTNRMTNNARYFRLKK